MNKITTIGLDLAKNILHVVACDEHGKIVKKRMLKRHQVLAYFINMPCCLIGLEACSGAHYWARKFSEMGHHVKLMPPQYVKAYVRGNKNDYNDALAIAEAVTRAEMRFVSVKTPEQQDIQAIHRLRERCIQNRTALVNQLRGLMSEYGITVPKGIRVIRRRIPELLEDASNGLSDLFRSLLHEGYQQLQEFDEHIDNYTRHVNQYSGKDESCQRLQTIPGFGPIVASVFHAAIGDGSAYKRGRDVSAALGVVPRQHSSGGKDVLLNISKRGDRYLRSLLVHGARSVLQQAHKKEDVLSRWVVKLKEKRGTNKATVALANKLARIGWAVLANKTSYQAVYAH